jgi:hypothetical protein
MKSNISKVGFPRIADTGQGNKRSVGPASSVRPRKTGTPEAMRTQTVITKLVPDWWETEWSSIASRVQPGRPALSKRCVPVIDTQSTYFNALSMP